MTHCPEKESKAILRMMPSFRRSPTPRLVRLVSVTAARINSQDQPDPANAANSRANAFGRQNLVAWASRPCCRYSDTT